MGPKKDPKMRATLKRTQKRDWPYKEPQNGIGPKRNPKMGPPRPPKKMGPQKWEQPQKGPQNGSDPKKDPKMGATLKRTQKMGTQKWD